jgi:hypothetical protein
MHSVSPCSKDVLSIHTPGPRSGSVGKATQRNTQEWSERKKGRMDTSETCLCNEDEMSSRDA